jgi:hypothetical protein
MGFLAPLSLVGALLALPVLAMYFLRLRRRRQRVSSTLLWRQALEEIQARSPWRRLRLHALLLLQLLVLALLVLALARPFLERTGETTGDLIVLVDTSASMQATDVPPSRFAVAKARAGALIDGLGPADRMSIIGLADVPQVLITDSVDRTALHRALDGLQPGVGGADLESALSLVNSLLQSGAGREAERPARVVVLSDGNVGAATGLPPLRFPVVFEPIGTAAENLAVSAFATRQVQGKTAVLARITNYGTHPQETMVELSADGQVVDTRPLAIQPATEDELYWPEVPAGARLLQVRLLAEDALALDNRAWTVAAPEAHAKALLVTNGNVYLERALSLNPQLEVTRLAPNLYRPADGYDLVVFDGVLPETLPIGAVLLVAPPAGGQPFPIGEAVSVSRVTAEGAGGDLLRYVDVRDVHIALTRRLTPPPEARTVLASPETPLVTVQESRERRLAVFGFDLHDSDLPLQTAFPILVQNLVTWLVPGLEAQTASLRPGETFRVAGRPEAEAIWVVGPDGRRVDLAPPFPPAPFAATDQLGPYRVVQRVGGGEREELFTVNLLAPRESRLPPAERLQLPATAPLLILPPQTIPIEIGPWLALLGLLVLFGEWWVYQRGY